MTPSTAQNAGAGAHLPQTISNANYEVYADTGMIKRDLTGLGAGLSRHYQKYVTWKAPNGGEIKIVAVDAVSDEQLIRAWNILDFYLTNVEGSKYGADKTAVANAMANNNAVLVMPGGSDGNSPTPESGLLGQPLYQLEFPVEGSTAYINNDYDQRDAGFEEILHLVHDYGIGTNGTNGALKTTYHAEISQAMQNARTNSIWGNGDAGVKSWLRELAAEGSLEQEYFAAVVDSYYGLWGAWTGGQGGMWDIYTAKTRADVIAKDPQGAALVQSFLSENLTYMARIDPSFKGVFEMQYDASKPYTHKSQYLTKARLLGTESSGLAGNAHDNVLMGNAGANTIDGRGGTDVVQYEGASSEYTISQEGNVTVVASKLSPADVDRLTNVEILRFTDRDMVVGEAATGTDTGTPGETINGTDGDDRLKGDTGNDTLIGGSGNDVLTGNAGADIALGGTGNDVIWAGSEDTSSDIAIGGDGDDVVSGGKGDDLVVGGSADDGETQQVSATLANSEADGNDILYGGQGADTLLGGGWKDSVVDNGAFDKGEAVTSGSGSDQIWSGADNDVVYAANGADTIGGGAGDDTIFAGGGDDVIYGGRGDNADTGTNDVILAGSGNNLIYASGGNDSVDGGDGADTIFTGNGSDTVMGGAGNDTIWGGAGDDRFTGNDGADTFAFSSGNGKDTVTDFSVSEDTLNL